MTNATVPPVKGYSMAGAADPPVCFQNDHQTQATELCDMTMAQLRAIAEERGIEVRSSIRKPLLIEMLKEAGV